MSDLEIDAHLHAKLFAWQERLGAGTRLLQTQIE